MTEPLVEPTPAKEPSMTPTAITTPRTRSIAAAAVTTLVRALLVASVMLAWVLTTAGCATRSDRAAPPSALAPRAHQLPGIGACTDDEAAAPATEPAPVATAAPHGPTADRCDAPEPVSADASAFADL
jgi:hypothetical protein